MKDGREKWNHISAHEIMLYWQHSWQEDECFWDKMKLSWQSLLLLAYCRWWSSRRSSSYLPYVPFCQRSGLRQTQYSLNVCQSAQCSCNSPPVTGTVSGQPDVRWKTRIEVLIPTFWRTCGDTSSLKTLISMSGLRQARLPWTLRAN